MPNPKIGSEEALELETIKLFESLGYSHQNCYGEWDSGKSDLGRDTRKDIILTSKLKPALTKLNPDKTTEAIDLAIEELTKDRSSLSLVVANRETYKLLKDGVKVQTRDQDGNPDDHTIKIIDWQNPENNDFFLASQFWITGETYTRRTDLIAFINGIPLVFIELKAHTEPVQKAYDDNFTDYLKTIPQLFWLNALVILSNGSQAKLGSITSPWAYFHEWKRIEKEKEQGRIDLETIILGTCEKTRLIDLIENYILYDEKDGKLNKIIAKNHQYLGVNQAVERVRTLYQNPKEGSKQIGVFWHTQGSGKSYSMQFFAEKVCRKLSGNWRIVVITDREDLDDQIYKNFAHTGAVTESEKTVRANSGEHLKQLLTEDHRYLFTLIQKFRTDKGAEYSVLSEEHNIIVIADEAHRSQYDVYSSNLRAALPNAAFIGFTGTPLISGEEEATREVFGDYVSIYNFRQSIEDGATVPLYYENRIPQLTLTDEDLNDAIYEAIDNAVVDEAQEEKLAQEFSRQHQLITRDSRLEEIAKDIVTHFLNRGYQGKAMVISIDRFTAVKMYDKVQHHWQVHLEDLKTQLQGAIGLEKERLEAAIAYIAETDMAVVLSSGQNEEEKFQKKGLTIIPHRERLIKENPPLDEKFKDADHPLRIIFVCAMWMTGFDVPSCSTIYLDKPLKNHTLMQTIARANRVFKDKVNGLIVDYVGIFSNLEDALKIYGAGSGGGVSDGDSPIQAKAKLVEMLREKIKEFNAYLTRQGIDINALENANTAFEAIATFDDAINKIVATANSKEEFLAHSRLLNRIFSAILPDAAAQEFIKPLAIAQQLQKKLKTLNTTINIDVAKAEIEAILDQAITTKDYVLPETTELIDISKLDFGAIRDEFNDGYQNSLLEKLQQAIATKLQDMVKLNKSRLNYYDKFQQMIEDYNSQTRNAEAFLNQLLQLVEELQTEDRRAIAENLDEEKLALFDLLIDPDIELTDAEKTTIKKGAEDLLTILKREKLVLDWRNRQVTRSAVKVVIEDTLDQCLPEEKYPQDRWDKKCEQVYQHIYESYTDAEHSIYNQAA
ncbi:type I restriction endonuclease subunit R [Picosynechococcus sp. PCC 8807]|uniref:type I restriction endonuclease subunit R n=1 Tax=Picosynechococcus sp. PCC 8807 TaxID=195248 RepID=UPI00081052F3|nr:type I restriction endonuclease subunit R [Picosynechococcus sp. PCC 8807]ANV92054.1 DEAD/DEAH box helicase [Picosynechococcus sp. PCC 8807]